MGTIFAPTYANLTMRYHKIKLYSIIRQSYALASKYFENYWFRFLDDCQILLKVNSLKPNHLLSTLNQINNNIQYTMGKSNKTTSFRYNDKQNKSDTKIWMDIFSKPTDSKRYVPFTSNHPRYFLTNIPFSLAKKRFKELKKTYLEQKYSKSLIEASILKVKKIPLEILRQPETTKNEGIILFTTTYDFFYSRNTIQSEQSQQSKHFFYNKAKL